MKCIIAGSQYGVTYEDVEAAMEASGWAPLVTAVVCGKAAGADTHGEEWARRRGIPVLPFPADWNRLGPVAGYSRNVQMAVAGDRLVAVWNGLSGGTRHMMNEMRARLKPVYVHRVAAREAPP